MKILKVRNTIIEKKKKTRKKKKNSSDQAHKHNRDTKEKLIALGNRNYSTCKAENK